MNLLFVRSTLLLFALVVLFGLASQLGAQPVAYTSVTPSDPTLHENQSPAADAASSCTPLPGTFDVYVQAVVKGPVGTKIKYTYKKKYCSGNLSTGISYTAEIPSGGTLYAPMVGVFQIGNREDDVLVTISAFGKEQAQIFSAGSIYPYGGLQLIPNEVKFNVYAPVSYISITSIEFPEWPTCGSKANYFVEISNSGTVKAHFNAAFKIFYIKDNYEELLAAKISSGCSLPPQSKDIFSYTWILENNLHTGNYKAVFEVFDTDLWKFVDRREVPFRVRCHDSISPILNMLLGDQ